MGAPIGGLMGIGGDSPHLPFTLKINGSPHGVADLQVSYYIQKIYNFNIYDLLNSI